jgi:hypothetical protein
MKSPHPLRIIIVFFLVIVSARALPEHPRLLVTQDDWKNLPERMEKEPAVREIINTTIRRANATLDAPLLAYKVTGRRMLSVSRDAIERIIDLSTAWKVSGEQKYLERVKRELLNVSSFKDWHPAHHLDTAEMQIAVAIGYDWLYDQLTDDEKTLIANALLNKGLKETFARDDLRLQKNNWNQVCMGGMLISAIALLDVEPELSRKAIEAAKEAIPRGLKGGYPAEGAYSEGGGYWSYGTTYSILSIEALRSADLGRAGILSHPGFLESGDYVTQVYGNSGLLFNYGDNRASRIGANPAATWMARETRNGALRDSILPAFLDLGDSYSSRHLALTAFWFPSENEVSKKEYPLHFQSGGKSPVAFHRTGHGENDLFLGIKAGKANVPHGHMDAGSFVIDWAGKRWASDLGVQEYHPLEESGIGLFEMTQESGRWTVFRLSNFSHNTLTYNEKLHRMNGAAKIVSSSGPPTQETLLDMAAPLGLPEGASAERRFTIHEDPANVTVVDQLTGLKPGDEIIWNLMTAAKTVKTEHGFSLSIENSTMHLELSSPQLESVSSAIADPPPSVYDQLNPGVSRIVLKARAGSEGKIRIRAVFTGVE